ncbi:SDR family oxidoreductase [Actomonas aquatica]|uniref:SDR family oxidoreductase n=1 Tax=Actomonas aquatica TaxID=2866162 RepID=A0ABZ1C268_9BACT|nr:SDR family oxidoreductase [Opitutus sp. WL0086]WRQ85521.1 SDR family oxidoreductase [Opitutus sp. WL0086]
MSDFPISLAGKLVVQFGGSGLLGRALAADLARAGAHVIVAGRDPSKLADLQTDAATAGHLLTATAVDITDEASLAALRDGLLDQHGRIDGVVFNAVSRPMAGLNDPVAAWRDSMETNATGLLLTARTFGNAMASAGSGSLVNIGSIQGMVGPNGFLYEGTEMISPPDYFFHKGGMVNLTRYLAAQYGPKGVRVNTVSPGGIFNPAKPPPDAFLQRYGQMTMTGRMAHAHEISGAVAFLLSDASTYVTGTNLPVDGGYTAK